MPRFRMSDSIRRNALQSGQCCQAGVQGRYTLFGSMRQAMAHGRLWACYNVVARPFPGDGPDPCGLLKTAACRSRASFPSAAIPQKVSSVGKPPGHKGSGKAFPFPGLGKASPDPLCPAPLHNNLAGSTQEPSAGSIDQPPEIMRHAGSECAFMQSGGRQAGWPLVGIECLFGWGRRPAAEQPEKTRFHPGSRQP